MGSAFQIYLFLAWEELYWVCVFSAGYMPGCQWLFTLCLVFYACENGVWNTSLSVTGILPSCSVWCSKGDSNNPRPETGKNQALVPLFKQVLWKKEWNLLCKSFRLTHMHINWDHIRVGEGFKLFQKECHSPPCPQTRGDWIPVTPLYTLVSGEQTQRHKNKQAYRDELVIVIPIPVGSTLTSRIQKQNHLNLQCNWEASGQVHVQRWDACCTWDTLSNAGLWKFVCF